jgi:hypothetical protein
MRSMLFGLTFCAALAIAGSALQAGGKQHSTADLADYLAKVSTIQLPQAGTSEPTYGLTRWNQSVRVAVTSFCDSDGGGAQESTNLIRRHVDDLGRILGLDIAAVDADAQSNNATVGVICNDFSGDSIGTSSYVAPGDKSVGFVNFRVATQDEKHFCSGQLSYSSRADLVSVQILIDQDLILNPSTTVLLGRTEVAASEMIDACMYGIVGLRLDDADYFPDRRSFVVGLYASDIQSGLSWKRLVSHFRETLEQL